MSWRAAESLSFATFTGRCAVVKSGAHLQPAAYIACLAVDASEVLIKLSRGPWACDVEERKVVSHVSAFAHVQCSRGGLVMPAHSPYDRQLLRQHVERLVGPTDSVQLGLDGDEWTVTRLRGQPDSCTGCSQPLKLLHCSRVAGHTPMCFTCVLAAPNDAAWEDR